MSWLKVTVPVRCGREASGPATRSSVDAIHVSAASKATEATFFIQDPKYSSRSRQLLDGEGVGQRAQPQWHPAAPAWWVLGAHAQMRHTSRRYGLDRREHRCD